MSTMVLLGDATGPALSMTMVYVSGCPAVYCAGIVSAPTPMSAVCGPTAQSMTARMTQSPLIRNVDELNQVKVPEPGGNSA